MLSDIGTYNANHDQLSGAWTFGDLSDCVAQQLRILQEREDEERQHPPDTCEALQIARISQLELAAIGCIGAVQTPAATRRNWA